MCTLAVVSLAAAFLASCLFPGPTYQGPACSFETPFESVDEYLALGFSNEPRPALASGSSLSGSRRRMGLHSHKVWITAARDIGLVFSAHPGCRRRMNFTSTTAHGIS
jgi:hypothetical protein